MSSSNRSAEPCDAVVFAAGDPAGPVRLPEEHAADFVEQFNRTYAALGMTIRPLPTKPHQADRHGAD